MECIEVTGGVCQTYWRRVEKALAGTVEGTWGAKGGGGGTGGELRRCRQDV